MPLVIRIIGVSFTDNDECHVSPFFENVASSRSQTVLRTLYCCFLVWRRVTIPNPVGKTPVVGPFGQKCCELAFWAETERAQKLQYRTSPNFFFVCKVFLLLFGCARDWFSSHVPTKKTNCWSVEAENSKRWDSKNEGVNGAVLGFSLSLDTTGQELKYFG